MISLVMVAAAGLSIGGLAYALRSAPELQEPKPQAQDAARELAVAGKIRPRRDATVDHVTPECTGSWLYTGQQITCTRCAAAHLPTEANTNATYSENFAGVRLRQLTARGTAELKAARRERTS